MTARNKELETFTLQVATSRPEISEIAAWLRRARAGYRIAGRQDEWHSYLDSLIQTHTRTWKLRPMLEDLRRS